MKSIRKNNILSFAIALASFSVLIFFITEFTAKNNLNKEKDIRENLFDLLVSKKSLLEKAINSRIYYTKGIAAYTSINPDITNEIFDNLANELIKGDSVISTMALSKDCIIGAIYPKEGHEAAIGLNLLEHPARKTIVEKTIVTHNTFVAGPVELVEGGVAFISYTPIFEKKNNSFRFWGVTDIVILKDKLFNEIKLEPNDENYEFALRGKDGTGSSGEIFWGDPDIFNNNPVTVDVLLPTGSWTLGSIPVKGWQSKLNKTEIMTFVLYICAIIISLLIWQLTRAMLKIRQHEKELKAIFGAMNDLIIEFNRKGQYIKVAPTNESLLVLPREQLIGKSLYEVFDKETADFFMHAVKKCFETKQLVVIDYPLVINNKNLWFQARLTYISSDAVLYAANDNTQQKLAGDKLKDSEKKLSELNAAKDKLFSIIAHDLRSPFNTTLGLSEILKEELETLSKEEIRDYVNQISKALSGQFKLLENLLNWTKMQTGKIKFNPESFNLSGKINEVIELLRPSAEAKSILLETNIERGLYIISDANMLHTILHNLITNAIKFTPKNGKISISAAVESEKMNISITDSGVGMSPEIISKIFDKGEFHSTQGTENEKGTGLGLALAREMAEKLNGEIIVKSEIGSGSSFTLIVNNRPA